MAKKWYNSNLYTQIVARFILKKHKPKSKEREELGHWIGQALQRLDNDHFGHFYTKEFGFDNTFFNGLRLLDVGCGPSGSLEWADNALERIGVDPLANDYLKLGASKHKMKYVNACCEALPFEDEYFDVVFSFNALDHVDDLGKSVKEITRVLKPGGKFLLITDCNHGSTITEPTNIPLNFIDEFFKTYNIKEKKYFEHTKLRIYDSLLQDRREVEQLQPDKSYILKAHMIKK
jgi:ubiquinone/menaquinone biosynthesis C-methylase UbiE